MAMMDGLMSKMTKSLPFWWYGGKIRTILTFILNFITISSPLGIIIIIVELSNSTIPCHPIKRNI